MSRPLPPRDPLPRVTSYLARLPAGAASYPECKSKALLVRRALEERPLERDVVAMLPRPIADTVLCPPLESEWVPEVHLMVVLLAIADANGLDEAAHLEWMREMNTRTLGTLFRFLFRFISPEALAKRVPERWGVFHLGSTLIAEDVRDDGCTVWLKFPPHLFHGLVLRHYAPVLEVALRIAAPGSRVVLVDETPNQGLFQAYWQT